MVITGLHPHPRLPPRSVADPDSLNSDSDPDFDDLKIQTKLQLKKIQIFFIKIAAIFYYEASMMGFQDTGKAFSPAKENI